MARAAPIASGSMVSDLAEELGSDLRCQDLPFETKRHVIKMIVNEVQLNVKEGWFKVRGVIRGTFSIRDGKFVTTPMGRGSWRR